MAIFNSYVSLPEGIYEDITMTVLYMDEYDINTHYRILMGEICL
jgi:hypothetical protein